MTDLFLVPKSKKDQLLNWILTRNFTKTSDIIRWGLENYHIRAQRDSQELAVEGAIRRLTDEEMKHYFPKSKEGVFVRSDFK